MPKSIRVSYAIRFKYRAWSRLDVTTSWFDGKARVDDDVKRGLRERDQWPRSLQTAFDLVSASDLPFLLVLRDGHRVFGNRAVNRTLTTQLQDKSLSDAGLSELELPMQKVLHAGASVVCPALPGSGAGAVRRRFDAYLSPVFDEDRSAVAVLCALTPPLQASGTNGIGPEFSSDRRAAGNDGRSTPSVLISEMKHRVKNILSMVHAIARLTLGVTQSPAYDVFEARILALARTQDLITLEPAESVDLHNLLELILAPHPRKSIDIAGPPLRVSSAAALTLSLGIHELATSALKYGALSVDAGRIQIRWTAKRLHDEAVSITWMESGGPRVHPPTRKGFGSVLIETSMARELQGDVIQHFDPNGVICTITIGAPLVED